MRAPLVIVTGFGSFPGVRNNPSEAVLRHLERDGLGPGVAGEFVLLDTAYAHVAERIPELLARGPAVLVMTGFSHRATGLVLERRATGHCSAEHPDIAGHVPAKPAVIPRSLVNRSLDFATLRRELGRQGFATRLSNDAGAYVCNHTYRTALQAIRKGKLATRALFVHLPAIAGLDGTPEAVGTRPPDELADGIRLIARTLAGRPYT